MIHTCIYLHVKFQSAPIRSCPIIYKLCILLNLECFSEASVSWRPLLTVHISAVVEQPPVGGVRLEQKI